MDTGALHGSYVNSAFVEKHRAVLQRFIHTATGSVRFGNDDNVQSVSEVLIVKLNVTCPRTKVTYPLRSVFSIVPLSNDIIIGLPDLAEIIIEYYPDGGKCVELKSLKYYFISFRNVGIYQEAVTQKIYSDLKKLLNTNRLKVTSIYNTRGGFDTTCIVFMCLLSR